MSEFRTGLPAQNDPDTVMHRAATAAQPSNGNVVPFPVAANAPVVGPQIGNDGLSARQNNPGNIKTSSGGYETYPTPQAGLQAIGDWGVRAQQMHGAMTLRQLIDRYAPQDDPGNQGKPLVQEAADRMGVAPDQPIDLRDPTMRQKWTQAIIAQEGGKGPPGGPTNDQHLSAGREQLDRVGSQVSKLVDQLAKEGGRSKETWDRLREATDKMNEFQQKALDLAKNPPSPDPRDAFQRLGGLATVVGILGGLLTKQPLMASLSAGAAAMEAYNKGDEKTYEYERKNWDRHTDVLLKMSQFQHEQIRDILYDDNMQAGQRMNLLSATLHALGLEEQGIRAQLGDERSVRQFEQQMDRANKQFSAQMDRLAQSEKAAEQRNWTLSQDSAGVQFWAKRGEQPETLTGEPYTPIGQVTKVGAPGATGTLTPQQQANNDAIEAAKKEVGDLPDSFQGLVDKRLGGGTLSDKDMAGLSPFQKRLVQALGKSSFERTAADNEVIKTYETSKKPLLRHRGTGARTGETATEPLGPEGPPDPLASKAKRALDAGLPRDAVRKAYLEDGGDADAFDSAFPPPAPPAPSPPLDFGAAAPRF